MAGEIKQTLTIEPPRASSKVVDAPHLFIALEATRPMAGGARCGLRGASVVSLGRGEARTINIDRVARQTRVEIRIPDSWMSSEHASITRTPSGWLLEDASSKNGVAVNGERVERTYLEDGDVIELGRTFFILRAALATPAAAATVVDSAELGAAAGFSSLLPPLASAYIEAAKMARTDASIAIFGETGTGKELCARALHQASARAGRLVAANCAALADSVLESELFGYVEGAFSGAKKDRDGLIVASDGGTLFLDEVGELPSGAQAALLRALQEREVRPVGANTPVTVDLHVISATHRPLAELAASGEFRDDLLARLAGFELTLPPLRERREDLGHLLAALLERLSAEPETISISEAAARSMLAHDWPRNVRELEATLNRALTLGDGRIIELEKLEPAIAAARLTPRATATEPAALEPDDALRRRRLLELLQEHQGNVSAVAREMGTLRQTVQKWLKRYAIDASSYRT